MSPTREIRAVSGFGARCGCGGRSKLHLSSKGYGPPTPETSTFLCAVCIELALAMFNAAYPDQPPYWPGDEDRDEPYVSPIGDAA